MSGISYAPPADGAGPTDRLAALEAHVAQLTAAEAARTLMHDYALACDQNDVDGVMALFQPDADLWAGPRQHQGHDEIRAFYAAALCIPTCHIAGVPALSPADDGAVTSHASFVAVELAPDAPRLVWGTYVDRIVAPGERARFASRRITVDGRAAL
ncbi:MAG TPA: nuclear transport factor 2 family protein [Acidimicrobiales bacterium]|nr:nuclear transport factor 2 family protein [Acidimicrobiales bacterium]